MPHQPHGQVLERLFQHGNDGARLAVAVFFLNRKHGALCVHHHQRRHLHAVNGAGELFAVGRRHFGHIGRLQAARLHDVQPLAHGAHVQAQPAELDHAGHDAHSLLGVLRDVDNMPPVLRCQRISAPMQSSGHHRQRQQRGRLAHAVRASEDSKPIANKARDDEARGHRFGFEVNVPRQRMHCRLRLCRLCGAG